MPIRELITPLGTFTLDEWGPHVRVGVAEVAMLGMQGCDPICEWDLELEEVLLAAVANANAKAHGVVPGAWDLEPPSALAAVERALVGLAAARATALGGRPHRRRRT